MKTEEENTGVLYLTEHNNMFIAEKNISPELFEALSIKTDIRVLQEKLEALKKKTRELEQIPESENEYISKDTENDIHENKSENQVVAPLPDQESVLPSFLVYTKDGMKKYQDMKVVSLDESDGLYLLDNGKESVRITEETLNSIKTLSSFKENIQTEKPPVIFGNDSTFIEGITKIPEFAVITETGLKTCRNFVLKHFDENTKSYELSNGKDDITLTESSFNELMTPVRTEKIWDEKSPAYEKLLSNQYSYYFETRPNTANNFMHNFSVYCRREGNSPIDAMEISKELINRMSKEEQKKTRLLLNTIKREDENISEFLVKSYLDAVKEVPLNEEHIKENFPDKKIARPFYDTITGEGQKIDQNFQLKIGDTVKNIAFNIENPFGKTSSLHHEDLKIISSSREGNSITLMDSNKSFYQVKRDEFLEGYSRQQNQIRKSEISRRNSFSIEISR